MIRRLYTLVFWLLIPFIMVRLLWRSIKAPDYRKRWAERFGFFQSNLKGNSIWFHAVSLGEAIAAIPLISEWMNRHPDMEVIVTTMTPTGSNKIVSTFGDKVFHVYVPYDIPFFVNRFLKKVQPKLCVILETELWPNLVYCCRQKEIPILLANARLSKRSANGYRYIAPLMKRILNNVTVFAAQTSADAKRLIRLGANKKDVKVFGNIKFDIKIPSSLEKDSKMLRQNLGVDRLIWIAASTHESEEEKIIEAFKLAKQQYSNLLLILVPRHPERFKKVEKLCQEKGFEVCLRTQNKPCNHKIDIFIGNTLGELLLFYKASDFAFVGGSLVPVGGHNLLEPASLGLPAMTGPHMHNFVQITELLSNANAIKKVNDNHAIHEVVIEWAQDEKARIELGNRAREVVGQNRGALERYLQCIESMT